MANSRRKIRSSRAGRPASSRWRAVAVSALGFALIASAYQFAFATGPVGFLPDYGPTTDPGDEPSERPGGVGGGLVQAGGSLASTDSEGRTPGALVSALAIGAFTECRPTLPTLPADQTRVTDVELVTSRSTVEAGTTACFHLHGKSARDGKWYDLTERPEARIDLGSATSGLVRQNGSSHRFSFPVTAAARLNGERAVVVGRYEPAGETPLRSEAVVVLQVVR